MNTNNRTAWRGGQAVTFAFLLVALAIAIALFAGSTRAGAQAGNPGGNSGPTTLGWRPTQSGTTNSLRDVQAVSPTDVWAVGDAGTLLHYDGNAWSPVPISTTDDLRDVYMYSATEGYIVTWGTNTVFHYNGASWTAVFSPAPTTALNRVWETSPNDVWVVGDGKIFHYNGTTWASSYTDPQTAHIAAVQMISSTEGWAVTGYSNAQTRQEILHYLNGSWTHDPYQITGGLFDCSFTGATDGWAVGVAQLDNYVLHYNGVQWTRAYTPTYGLSRVSMLTPTDGWAVGFDPNYGTAKIAHFNGSAFVFQDSPVQHPLNSISMRTTTDGWIAGDQGTILHYYDDLTPSPSPSETATQPATPTVVPPGTSTSTSTATAQPPTATATTCSIEYPDVPPGSTFYQYVHCLACRGIISGYPNGTFGPGNPVTRGQLSKIVSNAAEYSETFSTNTFEDVPVGSTFFPYVERLYLHGGIGGYACGGAGEPCVPPANKPYFRPNANVTRGQTSKIVATARQLPPPSPGQQTFEDVAPNSTFWQWIEPLAASGAIGGYPCGGEGEPCVPPANRPYFRPGANVTRGQSAKIVSSAFFPGCAALSGSPAN